MSDEFGRLNDEKDNSALSIQHSALRVPEIRFKGFSGQWEKKELGELADIVRGASPRPIEDPKWFDINSSVGWLRIRDVTKQDGRIHYLEQRISKLGQEKTRVLFEQHLLLSIAASVGKPVMNYVETGVHDGFLIFKNPGFDLEYMYQWLKSFEPEWQQYGQPGSQVNLNSDIVKSQIVFTPSAEEQTAIGNTFQKLDSLINQHQQKHDKLSNIKKAMLEKMFPKQGETTPEIRFKGFSGAWEEKELGALAEIVRGASPRPIEDPKWFDRNSSVGWLRIRDVTEQDGRINYLEQRISKLGQEKTRVLFEQHLLLSIAASVGKPVINYVETGVHDGFLIFQKPLFELEFMYQWLKSFESMWQQYGQPGSQVNLNSDIVKSQIVAIPSNKEQTAIGNYFQKLDTLINRHQHQITKLNNIKQAFLSKMFV